MGYTNSDYARDIDDRKSTSGYVFFLNRAVICWSSRKQGILTLSSTEAEYVVVTASACHGVWLKGILKELGVQSSECIDIMCDISSTIKLSKNPVMHQRTKHIDVSIDITCDSSSVIKLSKNPVMHQRTKHIDVRYHYLRNLLTNGTVRLVFCGTEDQVTDIMTKPIKLDQFVKFRGMLGVRQLE